MKRWNIALIALLGFLLIGQIAHHFFDRDGSLIVDPDLISVATSFGQRISLGQLLSDDKENRIFLMSLNDCEPCLANGLARLEDTDPSKAQPLVIIVNDWQEEVEGFSYHYPKIPFYRMDSDHYKSIGDFSRLPVYLKFENDRWTHIELIEFETIVPPEITVRKK